MKKEFEPVPIMFESRSPQGGFYVRPSQGELKHFPTATVVQELQDGSIVLLFDHIYLAHFPKGEFVNFFPGAASCKRKRVIWRALHKQGTRNHL